MTDQEQQDKYSQRIARVLGQERLALPSEKQKDFLDRAYSRLLREEVSLEKISDQEILGVFDRIMLHSSPIALEVA
jgi:hypothetical protein